MSTKKYLITYTFNKPLTMTSLVQANTEQQAKEIVIKDCSKKRMLDPHIISCNEIKDVIFEEV
jgi:hypothetical protein